MSDYVKLNKKDLTPLKGTGGWIGELDPNDYYYNKKDGNFYYQPSDMIIGRKSMYNKVPDGSALYERLLKKYPREGNRYGKDFNPILDKYATINTGKLTNYDSADGSSIRFPFDMLIDEGEDSES